jgi:hypothetical protein
VTAGPPAVPDDHGDRSAPAADGSIPDAPIADGPRADGPGAGGPGAGIAGLLDAAALAEAVRRRRAERQTRDRSRELATWVGTLRDLAEAAAVVTVTTTAGSAHRGVLVGVAADHLVVQPGNGVSVVARAAVVTVRPAVVDGSVRPAAGDRDPASAARLLDVLDRWREDAAPCHVTLRDGDVVQGHLGTVGEDVVSVVTGDGAVHLPVDAIVAVTVR